MNRGGPEEVGEGAAGVGRLPVSVRLIPVSSNFKEPCLVMMGHGADWGCRFHLFLAMAATSGIKKHEGDQGVTASFVIEDGVPYKAAEPSSD